MKTHFVAVYGTLKGMDKIGRPWKDSPDSVKFLGRAYTSSEDFEMHGGHFPVVNRGKGPFKGRVLVEIYEVHEKVLHRLDAYEGAPDFYKAERVSFQTEDGEDIIALMYLGNDVNKTLEHRPIIKPASGVLYWPYPSEYKPEQILP